MASVVWLVHLGLPMKIRPLHDGVLAEVGKTADGLFNFVIAAGDVELGGKS